MGWEVRIPLEITMVVEGKIVMLRIRHVHGVEMIVRLLVHSQGVVDSFKISLAGNR